MLEARMFIGTHSATCSHPLTVCLSPSCGCKYLLELWWLSPADVNCMKGPVLSEQYTPCKSDGRCCDSHRHSLQALQPRAACTSQPCFKAALAVDSCVCVVIYVRPNQPLSCHQACGVLVTARVVFHVMGCTELHVEEGAPRRWPPRTLDL